MTVTTILDVFKEGTREMEENAITISVKLIIHASTLGNVERENEKKQSGSMCVVKVRNNALGKVRT